MGEYYLHANLHKKSLPYTFYIKKYSALYAFYSLLLTPL